MLEIPKQYIYDEQNRPLAVQIPIEIFRQIEEVLENYGLAKLMDEVADDKLLSGDVAESYYQLSKAENVDR